MWHIILSECWLSKVIKLPLLEVYKSNFTKNIRNQNYDIIIYSVVEPDFTNANCLVYRIGTNLVKVALCRYLSFNTLDALNGFLNCLNSGLLNISSFQHIAILGDVNINIRNYPHVNIDIKPCNHEDNSSDYLTLLACHGVLPAHQFPTGVNNYLDHILLKLKMPPLH